MKSQISGLFRTNGNPVTTFVTDFLAAFCHLAEALSRNRSLFFILALLTYRAENVSKVRLRHSLLKLNNTHTGWVFQPSRSNQPMQHK